MKKYLLLLATVFMVSCSNDSDEINENATMDDLAARPPLTIINNPLEPSPTSSSPVCSWPGFSGDYGCGFRRGYDDYVYHYNILKTEMNLGPCVTYRALNSTGSYQISVSSGYFIPQEVKERFQHYYNFLSSRAGLGDYQAGYFAGYAAFWNAEPLSVDPNCN